MYIELYHKKAEPENEVTPTYIVCVSLSCVFRLAMKLLDKKRIKVKKGECLAVNERNMLAKVQYIMCGQM